MPNLLLGCTPLVLSSVFPLAAQNWPAWRGPTGATAVVKAGMEFEVLATNRLDDVFDATPVAVGRELLMRGRDHLYCIAESSSPRP